MLKYELKKIWGNKFFLVFLVLFLCMDLILIYQDNLTQINIMDAETYIRNEELYQEIKGPITSEKVNRLQREIGDTASYGLMAEMMYADMKSLYEYRTRAEEAAELALSNAEIYTALGEEREAQYSHYIAGLFQGRRIDEYYKYKGIDSYFRHAYSAVMVFVLLLTGNASLFYRDKKNGMHLIVYTSRYGKVRLWKWKTEALLLSAVVLMTGFRLMEYVVYFFLYKFDGLHMPLYYVSEYAASFYEGSILSVLFLDWSFKLLVILFVGLVLCILPRFFKWQWLSCVLSCCIVCLVPLPAKLFQLYKILKECQLVYIGKWAFNELWFDAGVLFFLCLLLYLYISVEKLRKICGNLN